MKVDLSTFKNPELDHGAGFVKRLFWHIVSKTFIHSYLPIPMAVKITILKTFGAKIGKGLVIKPSVNIKYPWFLEIGENCWLGEEVWIDNLVWVKLGHNVCLSQGAMLLTGNHDYTKTGFDLITGEIKIEDGAWVGAKSLVCPGVNLRSHSVLSAYSMATRDLDENGIYKGNPAEFIKIRAFK